MQLTKIRVLFISLSPCNTPSCKTLGYGFADIELRIVGVIFTLDSIEVSTSHSQGTAPTLQGRFPEARHEALKNYSSLHINEKFTGALVDFNKDTILLVRKLANKQDIQRAQAGSMDEVVLSIGTP
jgi:hypothetical protein